MRFRGVPGAFLLITYRDPEANERYTFLSPMPEGFRPGHLVWLYRLGWSIKKRYGTLNNSTRWLAATHTHLLRFQDSDRS